MAEPHTCPTCNGTKQAPNPRTRELDTCPTCNGEGVVWDRAVEEATNVPAQDPRELTGL